MQLRDIRRWPVESLLRLLHLKHFAEPAGMDKVQAFRLEQLTTL